MNTVATPTLEPLRLRPTAELIADKVREWILTGGLPPGERVAESRLTEMLGISRGPVREALQRLVQEGLLVNTLNRGVCVVDLTLDDLLDIYVARHAIEREALIRLQGMDNRALAAGLRGIIDKMRRGLAAHDRRAYVLLDMEFHTMIVDAAGSLRLSRIYATLAAEFQLCVLTAFGVNDSTEGLAEQHSLLVDHIENGRHDLLLAEFEKHLARGIDRFSHAPGIKR